VCVGGGSGNCTVHMMFTIVCRHGHFYLSGFTCSVLHGASHSRRQQVEIVMEASMAACPRSC
jgi:hypothetical protein